MACVFEILGIVAVKGKTRRKNTLTNSTLHSCNLPWLSLTIITFL